MKIRPSFSQKSEANQPAERIWAEHAKHLEPSCTHNDNRRTEASSEEITSSENAAPLPLMTIYLPYMSWMKYGDYSALKSPQKSSLPKTRAASRRTYVAEPMISKRLNGSSSWPIMASPTVIDSQAYPRRSLDQFYYPALNDTRVRDKDQTISKWTGELLKPNGREEAANDSAMIMVDQFWCWILDEDTILTSFPSGAYSVSPPDSRDLYWSIAKSLSSNPRRLKSVGSMYSLLLTEVATYMFSQDNRSSIDMVEIYRWVTGKNAATQTSYFQEFQQGYANGGSDDAIFNNRRDLKLVLGVADIIEELKMINHLMTIQRNVTHSSMYSQNMLSIMSGHMHKYELEASIIVEVLEQINSISEDADHTREMLLALLDLKSKAASLTEARASASEAKAATAQGRAVMLFTIITVIFLPLSFFTSYFGQNVKELTGDENNPSSWHLWRVATPITVVIIVVALLIAYYITRPSSPLWIWQDPPEEEASATVEVVSTETRHVKREKRDPSSGPWRLKFWKRKKTNDKDVEMNST
ncbi:hypothetical protein AG0111_0g2554 [Alternaria gaisen]|uniref:Uncharacterized protein n=1 Tax=Alternaria gaisen TaxID=167740 RepID=A0ACB6FXA6_9PLEO|nr:hypothetical protein AG0111_0g2554 [Alternaria gaisen]